MERRKFVKNLFIVTAAAVALPRVATAAGEEDCEVVEGMKSFGFYEGLSPMGTRSPSRPDGTYYNMPCIPLADVEAGEEKTYPFWHGHSSRHTFTVTVEHFEQLNAGESVELHTNVVDGHRHALRITPTEACET